MMQCKTVWVTGGAQGIGRAVVDTFLEGGFCAVVLDVDAEAGEEALAGWDSERVRFVQGDVSCEADVCRAVEVATTAFGRLDVLVNNAGVGCRKPLAQLTLEDWNRVIGCNLTGAFLCARHAAEHLRRTRGSIVNIASTRAMMSEPDTEAYAASKGGLVALTHALAISLGPEIRVNCVSPGWIDVTGQQKRSLRRQAVLSENDHAQHPCGRVGRPEDVAGMVFYLAGEQQGFITGSHVVVDGGMTRKMIYEP